MLFKLIIQNFKSLVGDIERVLHCWNNRFPPLGFNFADLAINSRSDALNTTKKFSIQELMQNAVLWAVPKKRVSVEKRSKRKYGCVDGVLKTYIAQKDLLTCVHCGHDYKRGYLCPNCYNKVMDETKRMQDRIIEELKLDPIDKEVVVLYKNEKENENPEFWEGKRIVEMPHPRPAWFSGNLLQKTTTTTSDSTEVKPDQLG